MTPFIPSTYSMICPRAVQHVEMNKRTMKKWREMESFKNYETLWTFALCISALLDCFLYLLKCSSGSSGPLLRPLWWDTSSLRPSQTHGQGLCHPGVQKKKMEMKLISSAKWHHHTIIKYRCTSSKLHYFSIPAGGSKVLFYIKPSQSNAMCTICFHLMIQTRWTSSLCCQTQRKQPTPQTHYFQKQSFYFYLMYCYGCIKKIWLAEDLK